METFNLVSFMLGVPACAVILALIALFKDVMGTNKDLRAEDLRELQEAIKARADYTGKSISAINNLDYLIVERAAFVRYHRTKDILLSKEDDDLVKMFGATQHPSQQKESNES